MGRLGEHRYIDMDAVLLRALGREEMELTVEVIIVNYYNMALFFP